MEVLLKLRACKSVLEIIKNTGHKFYSENIIYGDPPGYFNSYFDLTINDPNKIHEDLINHLNENYKLILFTKDLMWKYENEFRLVVISADEDVFEIDIADSIVGIVLGSQFPNCYDPLIVKARNDYSIPSAMIEWKFGMPYIFPWPSA